MTNFFKYSCEGSFGTTYLAPTRMRSADYHCAFPWLDQSCSKALFDITLTF